MRAKTESIQGTKVKLAPARVEDIPAYLEYIALVLSDGKGMVMAGEERDEAFAERVSTSVGEPDHLLLLAWASDQIVGEVSFQRHPRRRMHHEGELGMSVHPAWRGQGLGKALLTRCLAWCEEQPGLERIALHVLADNEAALGLYRQKGFTEEGQRSRVIKREDGSYADDILMVRWTARGRPQP